MAERTLDQEVQRLVKEQDPNAAFLQLVRMSALPAVDSAHVASLVRIILDKNLGCDMSASLFQWALRHLVQDQQQRLADWFGYYARQHELVAALQDPANAQLQSIIVSSWLENNDTTFARITDLLVRTRGHLSDEVLAKVGLRMHNEDAGGTEAAEALRSIGHLLDENERAAVALRAAREEPPTNEQIFAALLAVGDLLQPDTRSMLLRMIE